MKPGSDRSGSEAVFSEKIPEGIDCQRCHGPGGAGPDQQALQRLADFWPALHKLGLSFAKTGRPERAVEFLERASVRSTDATVLNDLALVY